MAQAADPSCDHWITNQAQFPNGVALAATPHDSFLGFHAEAIAGNLKIFCANPSNAPVTLYASADPHGHWPARNWQTYPMTQHGARCEVTIPVPDVDLPIAYFVRIAQTCSPLRLCKPRELGLVEPTGHFWTFLEGFEEDLAAWHLLSPALALQTSPGAKSGRAALLVRLPAEKHAVTIATTLLRGWQLKQHRALGLRLWLRTESGQARARLSLFENAFTTRQCIQTLPELLSFGPSWQKVDLYFTELPSLDLADVDLFTIELIAQGPCGVLVDDLEIIAKN